MPPSRMLLFLASTSATSETADVRTEGDVVDDRIDPSKTLIAAVDVETLRSESFLHAGVRSGEGERPCWDEARASRHPGACNSASVLSRPPNSTD